jgi:beta-lactamase class C
MSNLGTTLRRACYPLIACLPLCFSGTIATAASTPDSLAREFEQVFRAGAAEHDYPAAALTIVSRDKVLSTVTIGHLDATRKQAINERTVFRIASVSKTFAAGAVGLLTNDGALAWDDPVARFEPAFSLQGDPNAVRLRHLLEHSSGLTPHAYDNLIEDGVPRDRVMQQLTQLEPLCAPGRCYGYQNVLFSLLEPAVALAAAQPYEELVRRRIFEPLEMRDASLGLEAFTRNPNHARPHVRARGRWRPVNVAPNYYSLPAAAGVNASIDDMARWIQAQLGAHPEVLSPDLVAFLTTPRQRTTRQLRRRYWRDILSDAHYGMGWRVYSLDGLTVVYHGGWVEGFRADVAFAPELDLGIAILLNAEANSLSELSAGFWERARRLERPAIAPAVARD